MARTDLPSHPTWAERSERQALPPSMIATELPGKTEPPSRTPDLHSGDRWESLTPSSDHLALSTDSTPPRTTPPALIILQPERTGVPPGHPVFAELRKAPPRQPSPSVAA